MQGVPGRYTHPPTDEDRHNTVHSATDVRPFNVDVPEETRRVAPPHQRDAVASRRARRRSVPGRQSATLQALTRYWATDYDWRKVRVRG